MKKKTTAINYTDAFAELQSILARLEAGSIRIDDLASEVEKAQELLVSCRNALRNSKQTIEKFEKNNADKG
jgi:exodeoxyribonuclease VII small subunit